MSDLTADLLRPGDHRAGDAFGDAAVLAALVRVEAAWAATLADRGVLPEEAAAAAAAYVVPADEREAVAVEAEASGTPLLPVLKRIRAHVDAAVPGAGERLHTGLTSQDVVDTALMLLAAEATARIAGHLDAQQKALDALLKEYAATPMLARTLGMPAQASVLGLRLRSWRAGVTAAAETLAAWRAPAQLGGAVGDLAAATALLGGPEEAVAAATTTARALGLEPARPWHTTRTPVTRLADALVTATDAWGHVAADVLLMAAAGEVAEPPAPGRGASSAMPHKANPVLATLLRRTATTAPLLAAQLHLAAATAQQERTAGAWHSEWPALRDLVRQTLAAADQATELLAGLRVHPDVLAANLTAAGLPDPGPTAAGLLLEED